MGLKRAGVIVRVDGALAFVPASIAQSIASPPEPARVPGAPEALLGLTVHAGDVVPVLAIGAARGTMLVCTYQGETIGLVGGEVLATGTFDADEDAAEAVRFEGQRASPLDLAAIYTRARGERWAGRWGG